MAMTLIHGRKKDLGGLTVARVLPDLRLRNVGGFVFFDHMGPANFAPGQGIDVRPHPHIGLATVTYLFEGALRHRDSLGTVQDIAPGDVNWMTAGRGIAHSERTPPELRDRGSELHGLQAWVALPQHAEECEPRFDHHPAASIPRIRAAGVDWHLVVGEAYGERSPVRAESELWYLVGTLAADAAWRLEPGPCERAVYVVDGAVSVDEQRLDGGSLLSLPAETTPLLRADRASRVALLGGAPLDGERHLDWNFVSSRLDRIAQAKNDWRERRAVFGHVPDEHEFIPLP
jgi:hypothetical protein